MNNLELTNNQIVKELQKPHIQVLILEICVNHMVFHYQNYFIDQLGVLLIDAFVNE